MTPAAITPAGRSTTQRGKPATTPRTTATPRTGAMPRTTGGSRGAAPRTASGRTAAPPKPTSGRTAAPPKPTSGRTAAPPKPARIINPASAPSVPGHRRRLRPQGAPKVPRRVSGPARGRSSGITLPRPGQAGAVALPRPGRGATAKPRSRPARGATRSPLPPLPRRLLGAVRALPDHPLLDRVVRGRAWIAVLGVMLAGIVAMQIEVLKLGASIGRSLQRGTSLQSRNEQLRASVAQLGDDQRIERLGATMGMVMPAPNGVGFVSVGSATVQKALGNIHQPNPQAFMALSVPNGAVTGASSASGTPGATAATAPATTTAATPSTATTSASTASTGTSSPSGVSGQTTQTPAAATSTPASITQPTTPASTVPAQTTSPSPGTAGAATLAPTQSSSPTAATGGAGVPAAG